MGESGGQVSGERVEVETGDGVMATWAYRPSGAGPFAPVIFYMDGLGVRPALQAMAERLASHGYFVLLPNMYYRAGDYEPFDAKTVWSTPAERARLIALAFGVGYEQLARDTAALLRLVDGRPEAKGGAVGCVGYCLGGLLSLQAAAAYADRVAAASSIHGGRLVTDDANSPHALAGRVRAEIYAGVAEGDPEHAGRLRAAYEAAGVRAEVEVYPKANHGFAVPDLPIYDREAAERHWGKVLALFARAL